MLSLDPGFSIQTTAKTEQNYKIPNNLSSRVAGGPEVEVTLTYNLVVFPSNPVHHVLH